MRAPAALRATILIIFNFYAIIYNIMSEICLSCPIKSDDEDYPVLCSIADRLSDPWDPIFCGLYESGGFFSQEANLSAAKVEKARKCAQLILENQCEFRSLEND